MLLARIPPCRLILIWRVIKGCCCSAAPLPPPLLSLRDCFLPLRWQEILRMYDPQEAWIWNLHQVRVVDTGEWLSLTHLLLNAPRRWCHVSLLPCMYFLSFQKRVCLIDTGGTGMCRGQVPSPLQDTHTHTLLIWLDCGRNLEKLEKTHYTGWFWQMSNYACVNTARISETTYSGLNEFYPAWRHAVIFETMNSEKLESNDNLLVPKWLRV